MNVKLQGLGSLRRAFVSAMTIGTLALGLQSISGQTNEVNYLMGYFEPGNEAGFIQIDKAYTNKDKIYLREEAYKRFKEMYADALSATKIKLTIVSATRNFCYQSGIWERKWTTYPSTTKPKDRTIDILKYSAMPGASRHHWGTDIDLFSVEDSDFSSGDGKKVYDWLRANASRYDFCQPYTAGRPTGYNEEKWHWSYMPLSRGFTKKAGELITNAMIKGFTGAETAGEIDIVKKYILGINPACK